MYRIENLLGLKESHNFLTWGRAYVSIAYLNSESHLRILLDSFLPLYGKIKVLQIRIYLPLQALPILQVFRLLF